MDSVKLPMVLFGNLFNADLDQLGERYSYKVDVVGSSPTIGTKVRVAPREHKVGIHAAPK